MVLTTVSFDDSIEVFFELFEGHVIVNVLNAIIFDLSIKPPIEVAVMIVLVNSSSNFVVFDRDYFFDRNAQPFQNGKQYTDTIKECLKRFKFQIPGGKENKIPTDRSDGRIPSRTT